MAELALGLVGADAAALGAWDHAVKLLAAGAGLAAFLNELRADNYWQALLDAALIQPLRACFNGVQILLDDTAGQAGIAVGKWLRNNLYK